MGFSVSFVALCNIDKAQILDRLGAAEGKAVAYAFAAPLQWAAIGDWTLVTSTDPEFFSADRLSTLSAGGEALACWADDRAMGSEACEFRDGSQVWKLSYDCEVAKHVVRIEGNPPPAFAEVEERAKAEQAADEDDDMPVDYIFDVPADVFAALTGFRYDEDRGETFHALKMGGPRDSSERSGGGLFASLAGLFRRG